MAAPACRWADATGADFTARRARHVSRCRRDLSREPQQDSYQPDFGTFLLKKVLPEGHVFPFDFGFIPQTRGEDGDPLDVLVIMDAPAFAGCVVECRLLGVLEAEQTTEGKRVRNDRYLAVAANSVNFQRFKDVADLPPEMADQIRHFFVSYNEMAGIEFKPMELLGAGVAAERIRQIGQAYAM